MKVLKVEEYFVYPQGVCRIRKPACAGNGCAVFPVFDTEEWAEKIRSQSQTIYSELPSSFGRLYRPFGSQAASG